MRTKTSSTSLIALGILLAIRTRGIASRHGTSVLRDRSTSRERERGSNWPLMPSTCSTVRMWTKLWASTERTTFVAAGYPASTRTRQAARSRQFRSAVAPRGREWRWIGRRPGTCLEARAIAMHARTIELCDLVDKELSKRIRERDLWCKGYVRHFRRNGKRTAVRRCLDYTTADTR